MPRKPRMYLPGLPAHIVQRGNNREPCFFADDDYRFYLERLGAALKRYQVKLHAYVLMTNHIHLLMTPEDAYGISKVMSLLGQQYVIYINRRYRRSGTLWEGRYKASIVDAEEYLLLCYRYIELNPVRAGMVHSTDAYPWSSYHYHAWGKEDKYIDDHEIYVGLGLYEEARRYAYRALFKGDLPEHNLDEINRSFHYNHPLGSDRFKKKIAAILERDVGYAKTGRPALDKSG